MKRVVYLYTHPLLDYGADWRDIVPLDPEIEIRPAQPLRLEDTAPGSTARSGLGLGSQVDRIYQDYVGVVGRPQLQQLLEDLKTAPTELYVRHLGELGDTPTEACDRWLQLQVWQVRVLTFSQLLDQGVTQGRIAAEQHSLASPLQVGFLTLLQSIQLYQRQQTIRAGHAQNRLKAIPPPGKAPYGYRRGKDRYALDRTAAPVVKRFFDYYLMYGSLSGAVRHIAQKCGKAVAISTGYRWLTNPVYRGDLIYQNGDVMTDTHVPIISRDEAAQVDRLLRRNQKLPKRAASSPHALSGLVRCQHCQAPLHVIQASAPRRSQTYLYLRAITCPQRPKCSSVPYEAVLNRAIAQICQTLPAIVANTPLPNIERLQQALYQQIQVKNAIVSEVEQLVERGILDAETAALRTYKLRTEMAQLQQRLAQIPPVNLQVLANTVSNSSFWTDLSPAECRFYLRELLDCVEIVRLPVQLNHAESDPPVKSSQLWDCQIQLVFERAIAQT